MIRFRRAVVIACLLLFPFGTSIVSTPYFNNQTLKLSNDTISGVYIEDHTELNLDGSEKTYLQSELGVFNNSYIDSGYIQIGNFGNKSNLIVRAKNYSHFQNMRCDNSVNPIGEPDTDYDCEIRFGSCICAQAAQQGYIGLSPLDIRDPNYTTLTLKDSGTTNPTKTIMLNFETQPHIQINAFNQNDNNTKSATLNINATNKPLYFPRHNGALTGAKFASCLHSNGAYLKIKDYKSIIDCTNQASQASDPALLISEGALQFDSINAIFGKIISSNSLIDDNLNAHYVRLHFGFVTKILRNLDITFTLNHTLDPTQTETHQYATGDTSGITGHLNILSFTALANTGSTTTQANADMNVSSGLSKTNIIIDIPGEILVCDESVANGDTVTITCE